MAKNKYIWLALILFSSFSFATPSHYPQELLYNHSPINPLCFNLQELPLVVSLEKCTQESLSQYKQKDSAKNLIDKGYIGYSYDMVGDDMSGGYSYYQIIGKYKDRFIIHTINNGGGSGDFTTIYLVKRTGNNIQLTSIASGDRANGGVDDVTQTGENLYFSINLTPYDLVSLANKNQKKIRAYDDLNACAVCYMGKANYAVNLNDSSLSYQLVSVTLENDAQGQGGSPLPRYQKCFDGLYGEYVKSKGLNMSTKQLDDFIGQFNKKCVSS